MANQGLDNKISNVIGAKLPQWVLDQLSTRSIQNNQDSRNNNNLLYLANKSAWVRLVSSVDIGSEDLLYFKNTVGADIKVAGFGAESSNLNPILNPTSLAKQYILYGGTSKYLQKNSYQQRAGLGKDGSYGIFGESEIQKYGYKPMPGITSVNIETQGRLGSVRSATINFKCWDKNQLDVMDALYFKLGFTMFLEWGHTYYYPSKATRGNVQKYDPDQVKSTEFFSIDPFEKGLNKEDILSKISQNSRDSEGNYDAMLGIVTNFNFTYTQDGGYDCTVRLMALGVLADGIKINNPGVLPDILKEEILKLNNTLIQISNSLLKSSNDNNPENILTFPECVQKIGTLVTYKGGGLKDPNNKRYLDTAIVATVNNIQYYFYKDGRYQTTGFSKTGTYSCKSGVLYIDNKTTQEEKFTYQEVLNANKNKITYQNSLGAYYYLIKNSGEYDYFAVDKFKSLIPLESNKNIEARINVNNVQILPSFNFNQYVAISLLTSALDNQKSKFKIPSSKTDFNTGYGIVYEDLDSLKNNSNNYRVIMSYNGYDKKIYFIKLEYDSHAIIPDVTPAFFGLYNIDAKTPASAQDIQDAIKTTIADPNTNWTLSLVSDETYVSSLRKYKENIFEAKFTIKINRNVEKTTYKTGPSGQQIPIKEPTVLTWELPITLTFNDLTILDSFTIKENEDLINTIDAVSAAKKIADQNQKQTTAVEDQALTQEALSTQISQALNLQSSLEIILRTIQVHALNQAIDTNKNDLEIGRKVFVNNFWDDGTKGQIKKPFLEQIFSNGIFNSIIRDLVNNNVQDSEYTTEQKMNPVERFKIQAKYGFATNLMGNKAAISELEGRSVDYKELLRAFVVPYQINQEIIKGTSTNHPVYIPLGLLLLILNHTCTIYDTKQDFQTPLVYIDFNPELNFFLTNTKQLSTNPWKTLIPFEGTFEDYKQLFDSSIIKNDAITPVSGSTQSTPLFNPQTQDVLSGELPKLKFGKIENDSVYRGRIMNILLNVDYVISLVQQYSTKDTINNVYLKPFLEQILADLNKYLGNFNAFRLSYSDPANTFQLTDDQFLPATSKEDQISPNEVNTRENITEIPLVGKESIAKSLDIKTEISSKLANMLAISANSTISNKSSLSTNASSYGYINTNYFDRYIPNRQEPTGSENDPRGLDTIKISAAQFNQTISDFYSKINPSEATVSHATNYYIEKMSKIKNDEYPTRASAMIPVSVNFTTDGISGLAMGQAFTISEELLPYTYSAKKIEGLPKDHINNVGFVMVGLTHTIENNSWNTAVRANMIFLKDKTEFESRIIRVENRVGIFDVNAANEVQSQVIGKVSLSDLNLNQSWENIAFDFIVSKEGFLDKPKPDEGTLRAGYGTDKIVTTDGTVKSVGVDTVFTKEDAKRTLIYQIKTTFAPRVISQIEQSNWDKLNDKQKASLISYAYNAGSLRPNLVSAIKSNTSNQIVANAIIAGPTTGAQSGKVYPVLVQRRKEEAALYLS